MGGTERENPEEMRANRGARPQGFEGTDGRTPPNNVREAQRGAVAEGGVLKAPKDGGYREGGVPRNGGAQKGRLRGMRGAL